VSVAQYREQTDLYADRAVSLAVDDIDRLVILIDHLDSLSGGSRAHVLKLLRSNSTKALDAASDSALWTALTKLVNRHRLYSDAEWAMNASLTDEIAQVADLLAPTRPDLRFARLFSDRGIDLFEKKGDYTEQHNLLETRRDEAVRLVFEQFGLGGVKEFATKVSTPWRVGLGLGRIRSSDNDLALLPSIFGSNDVALREFGRGYISGRFMQEGWTWFDSLDFKRWTSADLATVLTTLPFTPEAWTRVDRLFESPDEYWRATPANPYGYEANVSGAIDRLINVGRPFAALRCIHYILSTEHRLLVSASVKALRAGVASSEARDQMSIFEVAEVFKAIQASDEVPVEDLIQLEWAYLPALDEHSGTGPKNLQRHLADSPEFFSDMIRLVFKGTDAAEAEERNPTLAANGYRLLTDWSIPPGLQHDGSFDGSKLATWLADVTERTRASGREAIAMTMAGHVLRHVPADQGGLWIDRAAALLLDGRDAEDLRDGFRSAEMNSRGVHFVNPSGDDERALADMYRLRAEALEAEGFHRFAASLRQVESAYRLEAEQVKRREW